MSLEELTEKKTSAEFISAELGQYLASLDTIEADDARKANELHGVLNRHIAEYDRQIEKIVTDIRRGNR